VDSPLANCSFIEYAIKIIVSCKTSFGEYWAMSDDFPFKIETLLEQCGGNKAISRVVLDEFLIQAATDIQEMADCLASSNITQVGKVGHRLKGTAGVLGASKLHSLCFALEVAGKEGNSEEASKIYPELKAEAERCVAAVPEARNRS
jgi:HPt (histidine-containing phosphotransfer) domain-containing protein